MLAAFASWADAQHAGGTWLVRMEDIDPPREPAGAAQAILRDLDALGLRSPEPVLWQSRQRELHEQVIEQLLTRGEAFECRCSRSDLLAVSGIHRGPCHLSGRRPAAIRLRVPEHDIEFEDRIRGPQSQNLARDVGDFVLRRRDGLIAYQLAVVVDDAAQGITDVVRGCDLLDSTARQVHLQRVLGLPAPRYAHIPLLVDATGAKLSKQNLAPGAQVGAPVQTLAQAARLLGQQVPDIGLELSAWLRAAADRWNIARVPRQPNVSVPSHEAMRMA